MSLKKIVVSCLAAMATLMVSAGLYADTGGSSSPGLPITDGSPISDDIVTSVTPEEVVESLSVTVTLEHTFLGDLDMTLSNTQGSPVALLASVFESSNLGGTYVFTDTGSATGTILDAAVAPCDTNCVVPSGDYWAAPGSGAVIAGFLGDFASDTWTLSITDTAAGDDGLLASWSIAIVSNPVPEPASLGLLMLAGLGLLGLRRRR